MGAAGQPPAGRRGLTRLAFLAALALAAAGCRTPGETRRHAGVDELEDGPLRRKGVLHPVARGQTLWRIARAYGITLQELAEVNDVVDPTKIQVGQALWIPGADRVREVAPAPSLVRDDPLPLPPPPALRPDDPKPRRRLEAHAKPPPAEEPEPKPDVRPTRFAWPVKGTVSSRFGVRDGGQHDGIDILAKAGTPILAADAGEVLYAGVQRGYGNLVLVKHADGLITVYAHNTENRVKAGEQVRRGQVIATVGQTGRASAPHVHFEVREQRLPRNPLFFLPEAK